MCQGKTLEFPVESPGWIDNGAGAGRIDNGARAWRIDT